MKELLEYRQRMLGRYAQIVDDLAQTLQQLSPEELHQVSVPQGRSAYQMMVHLRDTERETIVPRLISLIDPDLYVDIQEHSQEETIGAVLGEYRSLREQELEWIRRMPDEAWNRKGRHPVWGMHTLQWWVESSLAHAERHLKQIKAVLEDPAPGKEMNRDV